MKRSLNLALAMSLFFACNEQVSNARSTQKPEELREVLAKIDDTAITLGEFQDRLNKQSPYVRARFSSMERKKEFLDNLVRFEVLAQEAERRGLQKDPEVVRTYKQVMIQKLMKDEFDRITVSDVTDADCQHYFQAHPEEYNKPDESRVSLILVKDVATAKKVLADARVRGLDNQGYRNLVAEFSTDVATKERGGDLRYFDAKTKDIPREIVDAAFRLQNIGDNSEPIKTKQGVAILKLTGRRRAFSRNFDDVKEQIRNKLYRDRRQERVETFIRNLRQKAVIKIDEGKLAKVRVDSMGSDAFPGPGVPPPGPGEFHPGAPGFPAAGPNAFAPTPPGGEAVTPPPVDSPKAPAPAPEPTP